MAEDIEKRKRAEAFADRMQAEFRDLGAVSDFFCSKQRERWREQLIKAYEGSPFTLVGEAAVSDCDSKSAS